MKRYLKAFLLITILLIASVKGEVILSNENEPDAGIDWRITLSEATTPGHAVTFTSELNTTQATIPNDIGIPMACFPNNKSNKLDHEETVTGWTFMYSSTAEATSIADLEFSLYNPTMTLDGPSYYYTVDTGAFNRTYALTDANVTSASYDGTTLTTSFEVSDAEAERLGMSPNITSAI